MPSVFLIHLSECALCRMDTFCCAEVVGFFLGFSKGHCEQDSLFLAALLLCEGRELAATDPAVLAAVRAVSTGGAVFAFPLYPGFF